MRKFIVLCGALLCLSLTATAQDSTAAFDASSPASEPASPASLIPSDREAWQIGLGFEYQHYGVLGQSFHTFALNTDVTRYMSNWFGLEGASVEGFGHTGTAPSLDAKSFFIGGGPHFAVTNSSRFEPWVHVLGGWQHFRFTQTGTIGSDSRIAFMAGGGVDYKLGGRAFWRVQADFIGTRFGSAAVDKNYSIGTGLVFNF